jgi:hypothetical protein
MATILVDFVGSSSYVTDPNAGTVQITVPQIHNNTTTGTTGSLEAILWYTAEPYAGGSLNGHIAATIPYTSVLGPNQFFNSLTITEPYSPPSSGDTYATLTLEEFDGATSSYVIEDHLNYPPPTPTMPTTPLPPTAPSNEIALHGAASQYIIADNNGSLYIQDTVAGRDGTQTLPGITGMVFTNGIGVFDPTGTKRMLHGYILQP